MKFNIISKNLLFNFFGTIFDKMLPIIVTAFLTKSMSVQVYNDWTLFYQYMIFSNVICFAAITTRFSRLFYHSKNTKLSFDNYGLSIVLFIVITFIYLFIIKSTTYLFLQISCIILSSLYSYFAQYLRFSAKDYLFFISSVFRFLIFLILILIFYSDKTITFFELLLSLFISTIPFLLLIIKNIKKSKIIDKSYLKEDFSLIGYGISSSSINGADKFIIGYFFLNNSFLGYYSLIYSITNLPSLLTEAVKKTINPQVYNDLSSNSQISVKTKEKISFFIILICLVQFILPIFAIFLLLYFDLLNKNIIENRDLYMNSIYLSAGFVFHAIFQIINPIYFYFKKSFYLLIFQVFSFLVYLIIILLNSKNEMLYYLANSIMLIMIASMTIYFAKFNKKNSNEKL